MGATNSSIGRLGLVDARPSNKRSPKGCRFAGIDGYINFFDDNSGKAKPIIVQVKSGHVRRDMIATLKGDMARENAEIGLFITLKFADPTHDPRSRLRLGYTRPIQLPESSTIRAYRYSQSRICCPADKPNTRGSRPTRHYLAPDDDAIRHLRNDCLLDCSELGSRVVTRLLPLKTVWGHGVFRSVISDNWVSETLWARIPDLGTLGDSALSIIQQRLAAVRARTTRRIYFGWWVSVAGAFNMFLSSGPTFQASSVFSRR